MFARVDLKTLAASQPAPLPFEIENLTTTALADLPKALDPVPAQFAGVGYWPVAIEPVAFDPRARIEDGSYALTLDAEARTVAAVPNLRDLTAEEIAALPALTPPVPEVLGKGEFLDLVLSTGATVAQIRAASDDPQMTDFWFALDRFYSQIQRDHPSTRQGIGAMVALGHISQAQADEVFETWPAR
ncbi:hypothetical protein [Aureimonas sp. SK2]|uniref:hypothetical protein n=1 Tax=Aureimonas sp. SK2 TaxID=3015992 RepID=UPI002444225C|nr:hypothetical protein [Aureimonas sp. SK2]